MSDEQEELFNWDEVAINKPPIAYWRMALRSSLYDSYDMRHDRNCTGWSYALGGIGFAVNLHEAGHMDDEEFERWQRYFARLERMEAQWQAYEEHRFQTIGTSGQEDLDAYLSWQKFRHLNPVQKPANPRAARSRKRRRRPR